MRSMVEGVLRGVGGKWRRREGPSTALRAVPLPAKSRGGGPRTRVRERAMGGVERARELRRRMSPPEVALWQHLRTRPGGFKFRRQHRAPPYTLDFFCREAAVAVEVDGDAHDMGGNPARDERRDAWLAERGIVTLRFLAADVLRELEAVAAQIQEACASRAPPKRRDGSCKS